MAVIHYRDPRTKEWVKYASFGVNGQSNANSVTSYGAKGDGVTDDTTAFEDALREQRVVFVPGGTYKLSRELTIRENCCLELSQDTVLNFTQTKTNCITLLRSASLVGNYATINVPYTFNAVVVNADTAADEEALTYDKTLTGEKLTNAKNAANNLAVPPYTRWDPMWKMTRYVNNINICKPDDRGFHYSKAGDCYGTAMRFLSSADDATNYMWGINAQGIRIAGGFNYGIVLENLYKKDVGLADNKDIDESWNHNAYIEALITSCKVGVLSRQCGHARLDVVVQPSLAIANDQTETKYAECGIMLVDSYQMDLSHSQVWDWNQFCTLFAEGNEYQHISMYGNCFGAIISDSMYHSSDVEPFGLYDIRDLIYTDTPSNLEKLIIVQEPITRWFKQVDGHPVFNDGHKNRALITKEYFNKHFDTELKTDFTDALATAIDESGNIYNEKGYKEGCLIEIGETGKDVDGERFTLSERYSPYYVTTGYIKCTNTSDFYVDGFSLDDEVIPDELGVNATDGNCAVYFYDKDLKHLESGDGNGKYWVSNVRAGHWLSKQADGSPAHPGGVAEKTDNGFILHIKAEAATEYVRFVFYRHKYAFSKYRKPVISVDKEIKYIPEGYLSDGVKVKATSIEGLAEYIDEQLGVIIDGSY